MLDLCLDPVLLAGVPKTEASWDMASVGDWGADREPIKSKCAVKSVSVGNNYYFITTLYCLQSVSDSCFFSIQQDMFVIFGYPQQQQSQTLTKFLSPTI